MAVDLNKHVWEGWCVGDFIMELEPIFNMIMEGRAITPKFKTDEELKVWCKENQPYYKKHIPQVFSYFKDKMKTY